MAVVSGIGWEGDGDNSDPAWGRAWSSQEEGEEKEEGVEDVDRSDVRGQKAAAKQEEEEGEEEDEDSEGDDGFFFRGNEGGGLGGAGESGSDGGGGGERDELMDRFQEGGGELDLSRGMRGVGGGRGRAEGIDVFAREVVVNAEEGDEDEDEDEEDEGEDEEEEEAGGGEGGGKRLEDLLWGHESWAEDGFDASLEEQVDEMCVYFFRFSVFIRRRRVRGQGCWW